jgi:glyoxylase-like metal-dependent hydrolase (beta-lactamase superfamily II)/ferredoxin
MATAEKRLPENAPGELYVDETCIDCALCRQLAPRVFGRSARGLSYVRAQPSERDRERALMAVVACPTASIGSSDPAGVRAAALHFPDPIADGVEHCGFASPDSYGAASYLIRRPRGNLLVDSPRAAAPLMRRIGERGGVQLMFLTHRDDVADHRAFRRRFDCERLLHQDDATSATRDVERIVEGRESVRIDEDLVAIPVPGHTRGSMALLYRETFLFSGDHLWGSEEGHALGASREVCWYSWPEQVRSLERLLDWRFSWVLPGHGHPHRAESPAAMKKDLESLLACIA